MRDRDQLTAEIMENAANLSIAGQSYLLTLAKGMSLSHTVAGNATAESREPPATDGQKGA